MCYKSNALVQEREHLSTKTASRPEINTTWPVHVFVFARMRAFRDVRVHINMMCSVRVCAYACMHAFKEIRVHINMVCRVRVCAYECLQALNEIHVHINIACGVRVCTYACMHAFNENTRTHKHCMWRACVCTHVCMLLKKYAST